MDVVSLGQAQASARKMHAPLGTGLARFLNKCANGTAVKIGAIGDSGLEGTTVTSGLDADGNASRTGVLGTDDLLSLVGAAVTSRYGNAVTLTNRAVSGQTAASVLSVKKSSFGNIYPVTAAIADACDLYLVGFGHNEVKGFSAGSVAGLGLDASMRFLEHIIRRVRKELPNADLLYVSEWPYLGGFGTGSDANLVTYNAAARTLCAAYGVEYADGYKEFTDLGLTASRALIDATNHPNANGHAVWARSVLKRLPGKIVPAIMPAATTPPTPSTALFNAQRIGPRSMVEMLVPNQSQGAGVYGVDRFRLLPTAASGWSTQAATPATTAQAGDSVQAWWVGADAQLRLDTGAGQGVVNIDVDGIRVYSNFDLGSKAAGQSLIPLPATIGGTDAPKLGVHSLVVTLVSGSMTYRGLAYAIGGVEWWPLDSPRNTFTGANWGATGTSVTTQFNGQTKTLPSGNTDHTLAFDFVGTKCGVLGLRYNITPRNLSVAVDGAAPVTVDFGGNLQGGATTLFSNGAYDLVSGLPYGRHSVVVTPQGTSGSWQLHALYCADETRLVRPYKQRGAAVVGDTVRFAEPFTGRPVVSITPAGAGDVYVTTPTANGFTLAGTAALGCTWEAEGERVVA